jgi:hypothetical protein
VCDRCRSVPRSDRPHPLRPSSLRLTSPPFMVPRSIRSLTQRGLGIHSREPDCVPRLLRRCSCDHPNEARNRGDVDEVRPSEDEIRGLKKPCKCRKSTLRGFDSRRLHKSDSGPSGASTCAVSILTTPVRSDSQLRERVRLRSRQVAVPGAQVGSTFELPLSGDAQYCLAVIV